LLKKAAVRSVENTDPAAPDARKMIENWLHRFAREGHAPNSNTYCGKLQGSAAILAA
jgi:hypothetical protein